MLRLAIQKSGRLSEDSLKIIKECGIKFQHSKGSLKSTSKNFPLELLYLRSADIPGYVADGVADIGIAGENTVLEKGYDVETVKQMGFAACRLSIAVAKEEAYEGIESLNGRQIATSYPRILGNFLTEKGVKADIHEISGSVEIAPGIGLASAICDLVESGNTLLMNGLKEAEVILKSQAVLIGTPGLNAEKSAILEKLLFRINAVQTGRANKYVLMNAPNTAIKEIVSLLPGMRSPTIVPLAEEGWSSIHSVINEDAFWEVIDSLRKAGAEGILVAPIQKMIL